MAEPLWAWDAVLAASGGALDGKPAGAIAGFSIDTRSLRPGEIFVALRDVRDGHDFVPAAFKAGAAAALVRGDYERRAGEGPLVRVDDPLAALGRIGAAARARLAPAARVIAVTGSAGKTGVKEMLRACLETVAPGRVHASVKSYNNHWGVPLMLAGMPAATRYGVFEIGMNHSGEISPLTRMVRPHVAIVTNVLPVHIGNFPEEGEVGIAKAKAEIFEGLRPGGCAVLPADNPHFELLRTNAARSGATVRRFREIASMVQPRMPNLDAGDCGYLFGGARTTGDGNSSVNRCEFTLAAPSHVANQHLSVDLRLLGRHHTANAAAVVVALDSLGLEISATVRDALGAVEPLPGRGAATVLRMSEDREPILLIDESYNANPASMRAAIVTAAEVCQRQRWHRLVLVLGDMLELGEDGIGYHTGLVPEAEKAGLVLACGPHMRHMLECLPAGRRGHWAASSAELLAPVLEALQPGDVVMVKGSLGSRMGPIVEAIKKRFDRAASRV